MKQIPAVISLIDTVSPGQMVPLAPAVAWRPSPHTALAEAGLPGPVLSFVTSAPEIL